MTAKGIYINVSRRNEDIPEFIEEIWDTDQFQKYFETDSFFIGLISEKLNLYHTHNF